LAGSRAAKRLTAPQLPKWPASEPATPSSEVRTFSSSAATRASLLARISLQKFAASRRGLELDGLGARGYARNCWN
jgi:hypothetical protein